MACSRALPRTLGAVAFAALGAGVAAPAGAQSLLGPVVRAGPQYVSYRLVRPVDKTISQFAVPFAVAFPVFDRLTVDLASAYATSRYEDPERREEISGLTDTQVRANYVFGNDNVVLTAGVNLPTGHSTIDFAREAFAAGQIGNDFLAFPVSNMGTGFAGTGGVAVARAFGAWNLGGGVSFRYSSPWDAFDVSDTLVRYQPGNEIRVRAGGDFAAPAGRVTFGATYSMFGDDEASNSTYSTGDRIITQGSYQVYTGSRSSLTISAWDLYRLEGEVLGGEVAPPENIANVAVALGVAAGGATIEPNFEGRVATGDDRSRRGRLAQVGLRVRQPLGKLEIYPSAAYAWGKIGASTTGFTGYRGVLTIRLTP